MVQAVTLHTNLGDVKLEVYCEEVPHTAENFLALCASGYYNGTLFHRNIRGFMIQGGDPTGACLCLHSVCLRSRKMLQTRRWGCALCVRLCSAVFRCRVLPRGRRRVSAMQGLVFPRLTRRATRRTLTYRKRCGRYGQRRQEYLSDPERQVPRRAG